MKLQRKYFQLRFLCIPFRTSRVSYPVGEAWRNDYYIAKRIYIFGFLVAELHQ